MNDHLHDWCNPSILSTTIIPPILLINYSLFLWYESCLLTFWLSNEKHSSYDFIKNKCVWTSTINMKSFLHLFLSSFNKDWVLLMQFFITSHWYINSIYSHALKINHSDDNRQQFHWFFTTFHLSLHLFWIIKKGSFVGVPSN